MKIVINLKEDRENEITNLIEHFIAYSQNEIIIFSNRKLSREKISYYKANGIKIVELNKNGKESTKALLTNIKGSLESDSFLLVYSHLATKIDIDYLISHHKSSTKTATIGIYDEKAVVIVLESEAFDYMDITSNFEKEALSRIAQDHELDLMYFDKQNIF